MFSFLDILFFFLFKKDETRNKSHWYEQVVQGIMGSIGKLKIKAHVDERNLCQELFFSLYFSFFFFMFFLLITFSHIFFHILSFQI